MMYKQRTKTKIKEKIALGVFAVSMAIVLALSLLLFSGNFTSRVIITEEDFGKGPDNSENTGDVGDSGAVILNSCKDSDGINYNVKGSVEYCFGGKCSTVSDYCSGERVVEFYCQDKKKSSQEHECEECDNGRCFSAVTKYEIVSSGSGGGGGSGGSADSGSTGSVSISSAVGETYNIGVLNSEQILEVFKNDNIKLTIQGIEYTLSILDITESQMSIQINTGGTMIFVVGQDNMLDLNNDQTNDVFLRIKSINILNKKATLVFDAA